MSFRKSKFPTTGHPPHKKFSDGFAKNCGGGQFFPDGGAIWATCGCQLQYVNTSGEAVKDGSHGPFKIMHEKGAVPPLR